MRRISLAAALLLLAPLAPASPASGGVIGECGDGVVEGTEACDDGNTASGDGCSPVCTCEPDVCGDGIVGCTESCDDGNTESCDGCGSDCTFEICEPLNHDEQKCVNDANRGAARVAKAQNRVDSHCLKDASKGRVMDFNACLPSDPKGKVAAAEGRAGAKRSRSCAAPVMPFFGYVADPSAVNQAQRDASIGLTTDFFGDPAAIADAKSDQAGSRCQSAFQKDLTKGLDTVWSEVLKAKKRAIKGSKTAPPAAGNAELVAHLRFALHASPKLTKALGRVVTDAGRKCPQADVSALFPGGCSDAQAATVAACAQRQIVCRACEALNAADDTAIDCDGLMGTLTNQGVSCL